jgi:hypothetical protein
MEELEIVPKVLKGILKEDQKYELTSTPRARYVGDDDLVGYHCKERPLVLQRLYSPVQGNARTRKWVWVVCGPGWEEVIGDFWNSI